MLNPNGLAPCLFFVGGGAALNPNGLVPPDGIVGAEPSRARTLQFTSQKNRTLFVDLQTRECKSF